MRLTQERCTIVPPTCTLAGKRQPGGQHRKRSKAFRLLARIDLLYCLISDGQFNPVVTLSGMWRHGAQGGQPDALGPVQRVRRTVTVGKCGGGSTRPPEWLSHVIAVYLIGLFLWRAFIPAHEYPCRSAQVLTITFDLLALTGLIGLRLGASQRKRREAAGTLLFWLALVAGVGLFFIRMSGETGWWTGHLRYELAPRPTRR